MRSKKLVFNILFLFSFLLLSQQSSAISISQSLDKSNIAYEDSAIFEITLSWEGASRDYRFDKPLVPYIDRLKVRGFSSSISSSGSSNEAGEITIKKFRYVLIPTSSGIGKIDAVEIEYLKMPDSVSNLLITEPMTIMIAEKIPVEIKKSNTRLYLIIIGLMLTAALVFFYLRNKKSGEKTVKLSPKEAFLESLRELKERAGSDMKIFQSGLFELLGRFMRLSYELEIKDISENEIESRIKETGLNAEEQSKISNWILNALKDKFRPIASSPGETIRLESEVRAFFENMKN